MFYIVSHVEVASDWKWPLGGAGACVPGQHDRRCRAARGLGDQDWGTGESCRARGRTYTGMADTDIHTLTVKYEKIMIN